jgi:hypothetical protein
MKRLAMLLVPPLLLITPAVPAAAAPTGDCGPDASAVSYADGLDKLTVGDATIGGLSNMAWDRRRHAWASTVDNHDTDPARIWFWRDPAAPAPVGGPLLLRRPDGTPYDGRTSDNEGLAILPNGDFVVSSETEPAVRIFGRDGVEKASLPVPPRFAVTPAGEAAPNATLEGLTAAAGGNRIIAAMEGALSGDADPTLHRFLVYDRDRAGAWSLTSELIHHTEPGMRIAEIAAYGHDSLLVLEAAYAAATGNTALLYAVRPHHPGKTLIADLVTCPTLGATAKQPQVNPLLDNYEGMAVVPGRRADTIHLISDDNFNPAQVTRVLTLTAQLP